MQPRQRLEPLDLPREVGEERAPERGVAAGLLGGDHLALGRRGVGARRRRDPAARSLRARRRPASSSGAGAGPRARGPGPRGASGRRPRPSRRDPGGAGRREAARRRAGRSPQPAALAPRARSRARSSSPRAAFAGRAHVTVDPGRGAVDDHHRPGRARERDEVGEPLPVDRACDLLVPGDDVVGIERSEAAPDRGAEVVERVSDVRQLPVEERADVPVGDEEVVRARIAPEHGGRTSSCGQFCSAQARSAPRSGTGAGRADS